MVWHQKPLQTVHPALGHYKHLERSAPKQCPLCCHPHTVGTAIHLIMYRSHHLASDDIGTLLPEESLVQTHCGCWLPRGDNVAP